MAQPKSRELFLGSVYLPVLTIFRYYYSRKSERPVGQVCACIEAQQKLIVTVNVQFLGGA